MKEQPSCQFCGSNMWLERREGPLVSSERWVCIFAPHGWRDLVAHGWHSAKNVISEWKRKWARTHEGVWPKEPTHGDFNG